MSKIKGVSIILTLLIWVILLLLQSSCKKLAKQTYPTVFAPGNISTEAVEYGATFSVSGSEVYFSRSNDQWAKGDLKSYIYYAIKENGQWSGPQLTSFSGMYDDSAPHLTNSGQTLYFISDRPSPGTESISLDIWRVDKQEDGSWGSPFRLDNPVNSSANEYNLVTDAAGNLYFASDREGGLGQGDLYTVPKKNKGYDKPINLGSPINSEKGEWNLGVSKDGKTIIFEASGREQNLSPFGDLYISFKVNNTWSLPQNIREINTTGSDLYPEIPEDHNILFYSSSDSLKSTVTNIYSIGFLDIYNKYRKSAVFSD